MFFNDFEPKKANSRISHADSINKHDKVERFGYIPFAKRVIQMEQAGLNLLNIRAEMCDFKPDDALNWDKDFRLLNDFDKFQQEEMAKQVAEKYEKMQKLLAQNEMIRQLTEAGYSIESAEEKAKRSDAIDSKHEMNKASVKSDTAVEA